MTLPSEPCHSGGVLKKTINRNLTLVTFDREPCHWVLIWLMPCHSGGVFNQRKADINCITLLTSDWEPCQLVLVWLMTLPSDPCHSGGVFMAAFIFFLKNAKPYSNDSRS